VSAINLLILTNNPERASFRQRILVYLDILCEAGIRCEVASLPRGLVARQKLFKRAGEFDGVFLHKKQLNLIDAFWLRRYSKKIIYNFDDAVMYSDKYPERNSNSHFRTWSRSVKLADMVIVGSSYLAEHAQLFSPNVEVLPIGLKVSDYFVANPCKSDDKTRLVWIGSKSNLNYLVQIKPALEEIGASFKNVVLRIVSDDFFDLKNIPVEKRLWSGDTRGINLATSDIGLAPLPDNRFTRGKCSFKVLEYAAAGLPVIASPIGTNIDHIRGGITGFFAENHDQWLEKITLLVRDPQLRKSMGMQGRQFAQQFDIAVIGKRLVGIIKKCFAGTA
jgi:glycosyltransferase involved in cell wall biosynthesis